MKRPDSTDRAPEADNPLTRIVRIVLIALVVYAVEWRMLNPQTVSADPNLRPMPWAILALLAPMAIGVWAFELATRDRPGTKTDALWGVLGASLAYVITLLVAR
jgi:hypothetical protein